MPKSLLRNLCAILFPLLFLFVSCKKDYLSKDQRNALFAEPTATEISNVLSEWSKRDLTPSDYSVLENKEILDGKFRVKIVSFRVNGIKEYGALLIPKTNSPVPVRMYIGGFGHEITTNSINLVFDNTTAGADSRIIAFPALRGQSLEITVNGTLFTSPKSGGEHCNAFDGATDDAIAFLNLIQQTEANADVNKAAIRGGSRGGTVALLAGIRDKRFKKVVNVVGPVNLFELTAVSQNDPTYQCQFLSGYKNNTSTLAEARFRLIASSPIYFAQHLPPAQLHMALNDKRVPIKQGYDMLNTMKQLGLGMSFELFVYNRTHDDIATNNPEMTQRIEAFFAP